MVVVVGHGGVCRTWLWLQGMVVSNGAIQDFLVANGLKRLVRAHECVPGGYKYQPYPNSSSIVPYPASSSASALS